MHTAVLTPKGTNVRAFYDRTSSIDWNPNHSSVRLMDHRLGSTKGLPMLCTALAFAQLDQCVKRPRLSNSFLNPKMLLLAVRKRR